MNYRRCGCLSVIFLGTACAQSVPPPDSFRCAVIGDTGTGGRGQYAISSRLTEQHRMSPFGAVLMLGDNLYGRQDSSDFRAKFERPYAPLLEAGVPFYAVLGNHDSPAQTTYKPFHMDGRKYYTFRPQANVQFYAVDSNRVDAGQLAWLERELAASTSEWKIVFFHHPIYSSGARHGSNLQLRATLEPLFVKYRVSLVLAGHDHFYERIKPQQGVLYFVAGSAAKLRMGNVRKSALTERAFDRDNSFLLLDISADRLHYRAISRAGDTVDGGEILRSARDQRVSAVE